MAAQSALLDLEVPEPLPEGVLVCLKLDWELV